MAEQRDLTASADDLAVVRAAFPKPLDAALVLGSGLGGVADILENPAVVPYADLIGLREAGKVAGHAYQLVLGNASGKRVGVFQGRMHTYQGVSAFDSAYPARLAAGLGAKTLVVTNAAGSIAPWLTTGSLMLICDHINMLFDNPLKGWPGPKGGTPFIPMTDAYDPGLRDLLHEEAAAQGVHLAEGIYLATPGPSYETPAEVAAFRSLGADAVGMSTVPEVITARALGMRVAGISLITNASGAAALSHEEVLQAGREAGEHLTRLLSAILGRL